jgi:hypothetical protein
MNMKQTVKKKWIRIDWIRQSWKQIRLESENCEKSENHKIRNHDQKIRNWFLYIGPIYWFPISVGRQTFLTLRGAVVIASTLEAIDNPTKV